MNHDLEPRGRRHVDQLQELVDVQVVRGRHAGRPAALQELDREGIGRVQREVRHERNAVLRAKPHAPRVAYQDSVGPLPGQEAEEVGLAGLLDARGRQVDRRRRRWPRRTAATASAYCLMS